MNYFYLNPNASNTIMQILILILLFVIGILMFTRPDKSDEIKQAISEIDVSCPPCPVLKDNSGSCPACPACNCPKTPSVPTCPEIKCPTVNDIVGGIFPGRNMGLTENGEYFPINAYEEQEIVPAYSSFINKVPAFKEESILGIDNKEEVTKDKKDVKLSTDKDPSKTKFSSELEMKGSGVEPTLKKDEKKDEKK